MLTVVSVIGCLVVPAATMGATPHRHLFLDDMGIEKIDGLTRVVNRPIKHPENPIVRPDRPWDGHRCQLHGTILYRSDLKCFQMWYLAMPGNKLEDFESFRLDGKPITAGATLVGYATSKDGVHWEKPNLRQVEFNGTKENNLLKVGRVNREGFAVVYRPDEPDPNKHYRAFYWDHTVEPASDKDPPGRARHSWGGRLLYYIAPDLGDGMWVSFSPDGVHWTNYKGNPASPKQSDSGQTIVWDAGRKLFVGFSRFGHGRLTARMESPDLLKWSDPRVVFQADAQDGPGAEVEGFSACIYEGRYIGLPWMRYNKPASDGSVGTWTTQIQLVISDDGKQWHRVGKRAPFLDLGKPGDFDDIVIKLAHQPTLVDDRILIYYSGYGTKTNNVQIGVATLRRDGWVSLDAGDAPGVLITTQFALPKGPLMLNLDVDGLGEARAAFLSEAGQVLAESKPMIGDHLRIAAPMSEMPTPGTRVRLRLTARRAKLYSYWFDASAAQPATAQAPCINPKARRPSISGSPRTTEPITPSRGT